MTRRSLFIFRRDLRLRDNSALIAASRESDEVIPVFIADSVLLERWRDSEKRLGFLGSALAALSASIEKIGGRLLVRAGHPPDVLASLAAEFDVSAVYLNRDYTPYARRRDKDSAATLKEIGVSLHIYADQLLNEPESVLKKDGTPYSIFTPWYRAASQFRVPAPVMKQPTNLASGTDTSNDTGLLKQHLSDAAAMTSRRKLLNALVK